VLTKAQNKSAAFGVIPRERGQIMFYHDRDAEIAAFIHTKGVIRCPTAYLAFDCSCSSQFAE